MKIYSTPTGQAYTRRDAALAELIGLHLPQPVTAEWLRQRMGVRG